MAIPTPFRAALKPGLYGLGLAETFAKEEIVEDRATGADNYRVSAKKIHELVRRESKKSLT